MYLVKNLYEKHGENLRLELCEGHKGINRRIKASAVDRPGLILTGYLENHTEKHILIFGKVEMEYLRELQPNRRLAVLEAIFKGDVPAIIIARNYRPFTEFQFLSRKYTIPLFRTTFSTMNIIRQLTLLLAEEFAFSKSYHGTLMDVYGVGVFLKGDSAVGKSEAALGLIKRGHRLIADDVVNIRGRENSLEGTGTQIRHHMEIRGIGIVNLANMHGAVCIRSKMAIDIVIRLEPWKEEHFYLRSSDQDEFIVLSKIKLPLHVLHVKPGRDIVLLIETLALNHNLRAMGYHLAHEFKVKLEEINKIKGILPS